MAASIGTVGDCGNAMAEALNGTLKAELVALQRPWRTKAQLEWAIMTAFWVPYSSTAEHGDERTLPARQCIAAVREVAVVTAGAHPADGHP